MREKIAGNSPLAWNEQPEYERLNLFFNDLNHLDNLPLVQRMSLFQRAVLDLLTPENRVVARTYAKKDHLLWAQVGYHFNAEETDAPLPLTPFSLLGNPLLTQRILQGYRSNLDKKNANLFQRLLPYMAQNIPSYLWFNHVLKQHPHTTAVHENLQMAITEFANYLLKINNSADAVPLIQGLMPLDNHDFPVYKEVIERIPQISKIPGLPHIKSE